MNNSKRILIKLYTKEIDYDVAMITHVISNRMKGHGWSEEQGFNISNTQDHSGEVHLIARFEENAINELTGALSRYITEKPEYSYTVNDSVSFKGSQEPQEKRFAFGDNDLERAQRECYKFNIDLPLSFNLNYAQPLRSAMHEYVVNRILYDWFLRTKPDEAIIYKGIFEEALERVKSIINKRTGIARLKPYPLI